MTNLPVENFGGNIRFTPETHYLPKTEQELLDILARHRHGRIRVGGSRHAWSGAIASDDVFVELEHFQQIRIHPSDERGEHLVTVGAGCQMKALLRCLNEHGLTIPSVGLIDEQTIAGAVGTGTHGSGRHCLSHFVVSLRVACYDETGETPQMIDIADGVDLRAAQCSLGCLGIVSTVTLPCIPQYFVREKTTPCLSLDAALALEHSSPLQQFFLFPHSWRFFVQERAVADETRRSPSAFLYRIYWILALDIGIHLLIKLFVSVLRSRKWIHRLYRTIVPATLFPRWIVTDRSDRQLVMNHELFRHFEMELFVKRRDLPAAVRYLTDIMRLSDDAEHELTDETAERLRSIQMQKATTSLRGGFTHHYPICFRRVVTDDSLISMTSCSCEEVNDPIQAGGGRDDWYAISLITYQMPRERFCAMASFLADSMCRLFGARVHWGKWFPQSSENVSSLYPRLKEFQAVCERYDPQGVFRNRFVRDKIFDEVSGSTGT